MNFLPWGDLTATRPQLAVGVLERDGVELRVHGINDDGRAQDHARPAAGMRPAAPDLADLRLDALHAFARLLDLGGQRLVVADDHLVAGLDLRQVLDRVADLDRSLRVPSSRRSVTRRLAWSMASTVAVFWMRFSLIGRLRRWRRAGRGGERGGEDCRGNSSEYSSTDLLKPGCGAAGTRNRRRARAAGSQSYRGAEATSRSSAFPRVLATAAGSGFRRRRHRRELDRGGLVRLRERDARIRDIDIGRQLLADRDVLDGRRLAVDVQALIRGDIHADRIRERAVRSA